MVEYVLDKIGAAVLDKKIESDQAKTQ